MNTPKISTYFCVGPSLFSVMWLAMNHKKDESSRDTNQKKALKIRKNENYKENIGLIMILNGGGVLTGKE